MQAVMIKEAGGTDVLHLSDMVKPVACAADEVVVKVMAAGVNPVDTKLRQNGVMFADAYPAILGCDGAGFVEHIGADVNHLQIGRASCRERVCRYV